MYADDIGGPVCLRYFADTEDTSKQTKKEEEWVWLARARERLTHPSVVQTLEIGHWNGQLFEVSELTNGPRLSSVLNALRKQGNHPPFLFAVAVAFEIIRLALDLYQQEEDVDEPRLFYTNSSQLYFTNDGRIRISQVGSPKSANKRFLAPELVEKKERTQKVDVWVAGMLMRCCLTGVSTGEGKPRVPGRHAAIGKELLRHLLAKSPAERWSLKQSYLKLKKILDIENVSVTTVIAGVVRGTSQPLPEAADVDDVMPLIERVREENGERGTDMTLLFEREQGPGSGSYGGPGAQSEEQQLAEDQNSIMASSHADDSIRSSESTEDLLESLRGSAFASRDNESGLQAMDSRPESLSEQFSPTDELNVPGGGQEDDQLIDSAFSSSPQKVFEETRVSRRGSDSSGRQKKKTRQSSQDAHLNAGDTDDIPTQTGLLLSSNMDLFSESPSSVFFRPDATKAERVPVSIKQSVSQKRTPSGEETALSESEGAKASNAAQDSIRSEQAHFSGDSAPGGANQKHESIGTAIIDLDDIEPEHDFPLSLENEQDPPQDISETLSVHQESPPHREPERSLAVQEPVDARPGKVGGLDENVQELLDGPTLDVVRETATADVNAKVDGAISLEETFSSEEDDPSNRPPQEQIAYAMDEVEDVSDEGDIERTEMLQLTSSESEDEVAGSHDAEGREAGFGKRNIEVLDIEKASHLLKAQRNEFAGAYGDFDDETKELDESVTGEANLGSGPVDDGLRARNMRQGIGLNSLSLSSDIEVGGAFDPLATEMVSGAIPHTPSPMDIEDSEEGEAGHTEILTPEMRARLQGIPHSDGSEGEDRTEILTPELVARLRGEDHEKGFFPGAASDGQNDFPGDEIFPQAVTDGRIVLDEVEDRTMILEDAQELTKDIAAAMSQQTSGPASELVIHAPEGARVFVDGENQGTGPVRLPVLNAYAKLNVRIHCAGYYPWSASVSMNGESMVPIYPELKPRT